MGGKRSRERAAASGRRAVNDAHHGRPVEDSRGYPNDRIYIQPQTPEPNRDCSHLTRPTWKPRARAPAIKANPTPGQMRDALI